MKENWEIHWKDYYKLLQIDPLAEPEVVKAAYRKLADKYHPDHNPDKQEWANKKFKEIVEAFEIISDPDKRGRYYVAYLKTIYPKPIITPPPSNTEPKTDQPPKKTATAKNVHHNSPSKSKEGLGNLHEKGKYSKDTSTVKSTHPNSRPLGNPNLYSKVSDDTTAKVIRIIFMLIGIFVIVAPWYKYATSQGVIWLVVSILLSIIFLPITLIFAFSFKKK